jgi:hypothetical protein
MNSAKEASLDRDRSVTTDAKGFGRAVFDRSAQRQHNPAIQIGLSTTGGAATYFTARRTEIDRKPARVVLRPNDGPGDWEARLSRAEALRLAARSKSQLAAESEAPPRSVAELEPMILAALSIEPRGMKAIALALDITENRASIITSALAARGLITKNEVKTVRLGDPKCLCTITRAGSDFLAASQ